MSIFPVPVRINATGWSVVVPLERTNVCRKSPLASERALTASGLAAVKSAAATKRYDAEAAPEPSINQSGIDTLAFVALTKPSLIEPLTSRLSVARSVRLTGSPPKRQAFRFQPRSAAAVAGLVSLTETSRSPVDRISRPDCRRIAGFPSAPRISDLLSAMNLAVSVYKVPLVLVAAASITEA